MSRHRAEAPGSPVTAILLSTMVLLAVVTMALSGMGGTYAYLNAEQTVALSGTSASANLTAGTATLTVDSTAITLTRLYPGDARLSSVTVSNTGAVALALSVSSITGPTAANGVLATVAAGACPGTGTGVSSGALGVTVAAGASTTVCLAVSMAASAPSGAQSLSTSITAQITGTQP